MRRDDMPLRPMMGARAFAKWGIDFVRVHIHEVWPTN